MGSIEVDDNDSSDAAPYPAARPTHTRITKCHINSRAPTSDEAFVPVGSSRDLSAVSNYGLDDDGDGERVHQLRARAGTASAIEYHTGCMRAVADKCPGDSPHHRVSAG